MSEPWEPPGQQPRAAEPSAPTGGLEPTGALPPTYPTHPTYPPVYPGYPAASSEQAQPTGPPASAGYPANAGYLANPYASPPQAGGPGGPYQAGPGYAGYQPYGTYQPFATSPPASGTTTITAAVIQLVQSTFWLVGGIILGFVSHQIVDVVDDPEFGPEEADQARLGLVVLGVIIVIIAAAMITLAILTLRRVNGCRIASAVVQMVLGIGPLLGLLGAISDGNVGGAAFSLVFVAASAAVAWLLLLPTSARYCHDRAPSPGY
ncbi:MAG TPA: hypothetical protein VIR27_00480 [Mycobacteriales bacterium]